MIVAPKMPGTELTCGPTDLTTISRSRAPVDADRGAQVAGADQQQRQLRLSSARGGAARRAAVRARAARSPRRRSVNIGLAAIRRLLELVALRCAPTPCTEDIGTANMRLADACTNTACVTARVNGRRTVNCEPLPRSSRSRASRRAG